MTVLEARKAYVAALRSNKYSQGHIYLHMLDLRTNTDQYCAFGVACHALGFEAQEADIDPTGNLIYSYGDKSYGQPPEAVLSALDMTKESTHKIIALNDSYNCSFEEIANYLHCMWDLPSS